MLRTLTGTLLLVLSLILPVTTAALKVAAMALPADFAATAIRLPITGYGGYNRGTFDVDAFGGEFVRIESRLAVFDPLYASNRGKSGFTLNGPGLAETVSAECTFRENVVTAGVVTFDPKKLAYVCDIAGTGAAARLTLGEPKPEGLRQRLLAQAIRRGAADFDAIRIEIESVHRYEGSRLSSDAPVGYLLRHDAAVTGALELTDIEPTLFLDPDLPEPVRQATLITAIAVSLLRDPANSALAD